MRSVITNIFVQALENQKTAHAMGAGTVGTAIATIVEAIPTDIGKVGIVVGILLSITAMIFNFKRNRREVVEHLLLLEKERRLKEEHQLKMEILRKKAAGQ